MPAESTTELSLGVLATSSKPDERRLPLHPARLDRIAPELRERITLETGYGSRFGFTDDQLRPLVGGIASRADVIAGSDVVLLPKPQPRTSTTSATARSSGAGRTACRIER